MVETDSIQAERTLGVEIGARPSDSGRGRNVAGHRSVDFLSAASQRRQRRTRFRRMDRGGDVELCFLGRDRFDRAGYAGRDLAQRGDRNHDLFRELGFGWAFVRRRDRKGISRHRGGFYRVLAVSGFAGGRAAGLGLDRCRGGRRDCRGDLFQPSHLLAQHLAIVGAGCFRHGYVGERAHQRPCRL